MNNKRERGHGMQQYQVESKTFKRKVGICIVRMPW